MRPLMQGSAFRHKFLPALVVLALITVSGCGSGELAMGSDEESFAPDVTLVESCDGGEDCIDDVVDTGKEATDTPEVTDAIVPPEESDGSQEDCLPEQHDGGDGTCVATGTCSAGYEIGPQNTCIVAVPPQVTDLAGPSNPTQQTAATFSFGCSKSPCTFSCRLETPAGNVVAGPSACSSGVSYDNLPPGSHLFVVIATDAGGLTSTPASWAWTLEAPPAEDPDCDDLFDVIQFQTFDGMQTGATTSAQLAQAFNEPGVSSGSSLRYNNRPGHPSVVDFNGRRVAQNEFLQGNLGTHSGADFGARYRPITDEVYMTYEIYFPHGFVFDQPVNWQNGKMPGFRGQPSIPAGQNDTVNDRGPVIYPIWGGSRKFAWNIYHHGPTTARFGDRMGIGAFGSIQTGEWIRITFRVVLNTPGVANGILQIWINDELIPEATVDDVLFRKTTSVQDLNEQVYFTSMDSGLEIPANQFIYTDNHYTWRYSQSALAQHPELKRGFEIFGPDDPAPSPLSATTGLNCGSGSSGAANELGAQLWAVDYETGDTSQWAGQIYNQYGDDQILFSGATTEQARSGNYSLKKSVTTADGPVSNQYWHWNAVNSNDDFILTSWFYLPARLDYLFGGWINLLQFKTQHVHESSNYPLYVVGLSVRGGRGSGGPNFISLSRQSSWYQTDGSPATNESFQPLTNVDIPLNQWFKVQIRYVKGSNNDGRIMVWQDDTLIYDLQNQTTLPTTRTNTSGALQWLGFSLNAYGELFSPAQFTMFSDDLSFHLPATPL